jgi:hypothetical protein
MAMAINPRDEVFLETSYALALSASTDQFHERALRLATELEAARARLVTTTRKSRFRCPFQYAL